jgi:hemerythrin
MIVWKEFYSVNIAEFDQQHRQLIRLINEFEKAMTEGRGRDALLETYRALIQYAKSHFAAEEKLMADHGFPGHAMHKQEHAELLDKVNEMLRLHNEGKSGLTISTITFMCDWLSHHILVTDKKYSTFLNARGIS